MSNLIGTTTVEYYNPFNDELETRIAERRTCIVCGEEFICKSGYSEGSKNTLYCLVHLRADNEQAERKLNTYFDRFNVDADEMADGAAPQR